MNKKLLFSIILVMLLLTPTTAMAHTEEEPFVTDLMAGQHIDVGDVSVWNDGENLYVEYETIDGWEITETHLYVGKTDPNELTSAPGQFPYSDGNPYTIPLSEIDFYHLEVNNKGKTTGKWVADEDPGVVPCKDIYIAAHAVVQKVIEEAPYYASAVINYNQGLKKDSNPVSEGRSTPEQGLMFEPGRDEHNFFSLGFGGWIIVEFDCPIRNGDGNDVKIIEDTWGSYPLETAVVSASQDGTTWTELGTADNLTRDVLGIHSISEFDLGDLEWAKYIKIVDTTDPTPHGSTADGYDLNAVEALQDCVQEETAWADEDAIPFGTNWAMYFVYHIQALCEEGVLWQIGDEENLMESPADEFNWPGITFPLPPFTNPFIVGTTFTNEFPGNSNFAYSYATDFDIKFEYNGAPVTALLTVSWSPGKSANEQKEVLLDGNSLGTTPVRLGTPVSGWWSQMARYEDTFMFALEPGPHTLNFKHLMGDGTLWDFVRLETICP